MHIPCHLVTVNGQYYCALLQDKLRLALHRKQLLLLKHGVIFFHDNATPLCNRDVQNLMNVGAGGVSTSSLFSRSCPM